MKLEDLRFGNAAGMVKSLTDVELACQGPATEVTVGSITLGGKRDGNKADPGKGRVYYCHPTEGWSLNSLGLPNMGLTEYARVLPDMVRMAHAAGKELRASIAGFSPQEYGILAKECAELGVDDVEINLGCPNVWGEEGQKPIASYHPELSAKILAEIRDKLPAKARKASVKISPVEDRAILLNLLGVFRESTIISRVVGTNTIPNQERLAEDGSSAISFNGGNHKGGLAGTGIFEQSLKVMETVAYFFDGEMDVTVVGGISSSKTLQSHLRPGVTSFQCGTAYYEHGPRVFEEILIGLPEFA
jgi:dihydroorotate dehydrogenase (fumarate)